MRKYISALDITIKERKYYNAGSGLFEPYIPSTWEYLDAAGERWGMSSERMRKYQFRANRICIFPGLDNQLPVVDTPRYEFFHRTIELEYLGCSF
jgi:hypothetical protein